MTLLALDFAPKTASGVLSVLAPALHAFEMHAHEVHAHEVRAHEIHDHEVYVPEMCAYEPHMQGSTELIRYSGRTAD